MISPSLTKPPPEMLCSKRFAKLPSPPPCTLDIDCTLHIFSPGKSRGKGSPSQHATNERFRTIREKPAGSADLRYGRVGVKGCSDPCARMDFGVSGREFAAQGAF